MGVPAQKIDLEKMRSNKIISLFLENCAGIISLKMSLVFFGKVLRNQILEIKCSYSIFQINTVSNTEKTNLYSFLKISAFIFNTESNTISITESNTELNTESNTVSITVSKRSSYDVLIF